MYEYVCKNFWEYMKAKGKFIQGDSSSTETKLQEQLINVMAVKIHE